MSRMFYKWMAMANWVLAGLLLVLNAITIRTVCHPSNPFNKILLLHLRNAVIPYAIIVHGWKYYVVTRLKRGQIQQGYLYASIRRITSFFMVPATLMMLGPICPGTVRFLLGYLGWTSKPVVGDDAALANLLLDVPWIGGLGPFNPAFVTPTEADWDVLDIVGLLTEITCTATIWGNTAAGGVMTYSKLVTGVSYDADDNEGIVGNGVSVLGTVFAELSDLIGFLVYSVLTIVYEGMVMIGDIWEFLHSTVNRFRMSVLLMRA